jgi:hypothetical protein
MAMPPDIGARIAAPVARRPGRAKLTAMRSTTPFRPWLLAAGACLASCSVFPAPVMPPSVIEAVEVDYVFAPGVARAIEVPASTERLTVLELHVQPAVRGERFENGRRLLLLPDGSERARLRCRLRHWSAPGRADLGAPALPLFPGARQVRYLDESRL